LGFQGLAETQKTGSTKISNNLLLRLGLTHGYINSSTFLDARKLKKHTKIPKAQRKPKAGFTVYGEILGF
jgi:hypothetical protein